MHSDKTTPTLSAAERLKSVRAGLKTVKVDGLIVPYADAFQSRNRPAEGSGRLAWLTGFRGSSGSAVVLKDKAAVFVDSRYTLSARAQIDQNLYEIVDDTANLRPEAWAAQHLKKGATLGYDPFLHTHQDIQNLKSALQTFGITLAPVASNPIDTAWVGRPSMTAKAVAHDLKYAGVSVEDKIHQIAGILRDANADAAVITSPDSVSWLLNIRVPSLPVVPVVHGYVLLDAVDGIVRLYTDVDCSASEIRTQFGNKVSVHPLKDVAQGLQTITKSRKNWRVDDNNAPMWFRQNLERFKAKVTHGIDPCVHPKAAKNAVEQAGIRSSHIRDGVALVRFMHHIDREAPKGTLGEQAIEKLVLDTRAREASCFTWSFEPIVGFNENGAFVHGQVPDDQRKIVTGNGLLLIDSGGQYMDGTTDVTRTLVIGKPTDEMKRCFTLVMKGHIALARAVFPAGTSGVQLDALARAPLWSAGLDYGHGTGHGVGYCMNVHEGPCNFTPKPLRGSEALKPGMLMSVEPGVYIPGKFGIRLENLYLVVDRNDGFYALEAVTLAPFDIRGINSAMMTAEERDWLNAYHLKVRNTVGPQVESDASAWLTEMTAPI